MAALPLLFGGFVCAFGSLLSHPIGLHSSSLSQMAVCAAMLWGAWRVLHPTPREQPRPAVRLTLTPAAMLLHDGDETRTVYLSDIEAIKHATRTLTLRDGQQVDFAPDQPHQIQIWALSIIEPWLHRHRVQHGSSADVPVALQALQTLQERDR